MNTQKYLCDTDISHFRINALHAMKNAKPDLLISYLILNWNFMEFFKKCKPVTNQVFFQVLQCKSLMYEV